MLPWLRACALFYSARTLRCVSSLKGYVCWKLVFLENSIFFKVLQVRQCKARLRSYPSPTPTATYAAYFSELKQQCLVFTTELLNPPFCPFFSALPAAQVHYYYNFSDWVLPPAVAINRPFKIMMDQSIFFCSKVAVYMSLVRTETYR